MTHRIGIVGTFDVGNYGDVLFPYLAQHELGLRLGDLEMRRYSYRDMTADNWVYDVRSIRRLYDEMAELDGLLVGGGHLIRFDERVAPGYLPTWSELHHPTGYWLAPMLLAAEAGVPVAWNALGMSVDTPAWGEGLLRAAIAASDLLAVREREAVDELRSVAGDVDVELVPDTAFALGRFLQAHEDDRHRRLLDSVGITGDYVIVQPSTRLRPAAAAIDRALSSLAADGLQILRLPISPALGDAPEALPLTAPVQDLPRWPEPPVLARIVGGARSVVAHSLHLTITSLTQGVSVWRLEPPARTKYSELERFRDVHVYRPDADDLAEMMRRHLGPAEPSVDVSEAEAQVVAHWDRVADTFSGGSDPARRERIRRLILRYPFDVNEPARYYLSQLEEEREIRSELDRERSRLEAEVARLESDLADAHRRRAEQERRTTDLENQLREAKRASERWEQEFQQLRQRRVVRAGLAVAEKARPLVRAVRKVRGATGATGATSAESPGGRRHVPASAEDEAEFRRRLAGEIEDVDRREGPLVSIVVLNRDGLDHLRRLVPGLARTTYRSFELIVVDNGSTDGSVGFLESTEVGARLEVIPNEQNVSFSVGNNQGLARASGELVLLLNNDIEPAHPGWLGRLVTTLEEREAAAVGARLVYPRRSTLESNAGDTLHPDLTLQHRGVHFDTGPDGMPRGRNLGAGEDPFGAEAVAVTPVPAVTAACMLVRRAALEAVGGLTEGYQYGTEDVDLCLKLARAGGRIWYDGKAVLWHHEYGTQNERGREIKRRNRLHNREKFVDDWGPSLFRQVLLDKLGTERAWSYDPLHVAITVTKDDPSAGWGDYYTAHELGDALRQLGFEVSYVERYDDRWYDLDPTIDVIVVLLDTFELPRIPRSVISVAWVRNWTQRWIERDWFPDYDLVLASSSVSKATIESSTPKVAHLFPLATNPRRFLPKGEAAADSCLGVFTGNYWNKPRAIIPALRNLPTTRDVHVHGHNWEGVEGVAHFHRGAVDYPDLPSVYRGAAVVIDDTAEHTAPYEAVNSRVFDALATGTLVVTDNPAGIADLFGPEGREAVLTWHDPHSLDEALGWVEQHRDEARERAKRLRELVLRDHTYERRAEQLRELLTGHVRSRRVAIAIGVPRREERHRWGDEHFARDLQRHFERRGHPCRVLILPEWEEAYAARDDVVLHLFGLSPYRTRPSQTNALWNISHPELVSAAMVDRYDVAFVAGRRFAEALARESVTPVHYLPQATEPTRFRPDRGEAPHHQLLFVGNSRKVRRRIVDDVVAVLDELPGEVELAIYGADWTADLVDPRYVAGDHVRNDHLGAYYASADVVLNDHWDDMRTHGFLSNRLYDALAAGAFVVSDHVDGIDEQFEGAIVTYRDRDELTDQLSRHLKDPEERRSRATRGRELVLARHTFAHRVERILEVLDREMVVNSPASVVNA